jgi:O-antigen/teichoic acid export membrane protein
MQTGRVSPVTWRPVSKMATETSQRLRSGAVIAVAMGIMNLSTYGYTVLAAHTIGKESYGAFSALMGALLVISVLSLGLQATGARRISADPDQVVAIERVVLGVGLRSALVLGAVCLGIAPLLNAVLHLHSLPTALMVGVAAFPLTYMGAQAGVLQGERRWEPLALVYLAQGIGRLGFGLVLIVIWPTELAAMTGVAVGCWLPVLFGWLALRSPREHAPHSEGHPMLELLREVGHSSQALLAFFALSNADILVARATMPDSQAGLYAAGLIMAKAILFLPQFVVVYAFPSLSKEATNRRTLMLALAMSAALGLVGVLATLVLPSLALLFVGGDDFASIGDDIWKFAIVGTLLAMVQLLVYSALARRQGRAVILIWTSLVVLLAVALTVDTAHSLVLVVVAIDTGLFLALLLVALTSNRTAPVASTQVAAQPAG